MADRISLNRFPLFGLFSHRAARRMGYSEEEARLLGYSTALLYAIFKAKGAMERKGVVKETAKAPEAKEARADTLRFGGQDFMVIYDRAKRLNKTIVGHEVHGPADYETQVEGKFPEGWHDRLAKAFDKYLAVSEPEQLNEGNTLFDLYKAWRDACKLGFNRVDLEKLIRWLEEHSKERK
jgi:hypothetical protein